MKWTVVSSRIVGVNHENSLITSSSEYLSCCRVKHQGQKPFQCDICKKQFVAKCNLLNHMWQHKNSRQRPFKCQLCNKAYLREALLDQHMRSHRGIKPFVCNECGLQFTVKSNWQRHVAEHSGNRSVRLSLNNSSTFTMQGSFCTLVWCYRVTLCYRVKIKTTNLSLRNYECPTCHKKFSRSYYLTDHLKVKLYL